MSDYELCKATFAIFSFNQEKYIRDAIRGAFSQTYERLEIILSDDCSSDSTFEIMAEMAEAYDGPHEVRVRRNELNLGLGEHFNRVARCIRGEVLVLAAGDDVSLPSRVTLAVDCFNRNPKAFAAIFSADVIDEQGNQVGENIVSSHSKKENNQSLKDLLNSKHRTFGATRAIRANVLDIFGPLSENCPTEDTPLLLRSLILGPNVLSPEKGVLYRKHGRNLSNPDSLAVMDISAIYSQYKSDVEVAEKKGLLTLLDVIKLERWMLRDRRLRKIKLNISLHRRVVFPDVLFYIVHSGSGVKGTVAFLARCILKSS